MTTKQGLQGGCTKGQAGPFTILACTAEEHREPHLRIPGCAVPSHPLGHQGLSCHAPFPGEKEVSLRCTEILPAAISCHLRFC